MTVASNCVRFEAELTSDATSHTPNVTPSRGKTGRGKTCPDRFVKEQLRAARAAQLMVDEVEWQRALRNYMLVAFHTDRGGSRALPMAEFQQLVAYVDEAIFDARTPNERPSDRQERLEALAAYLTSVVHGATPLRVPTCKGAAHAVIAGAAIQRMRCQYERGADKRIFAGWVRSLTSLLRASVEEVRHWPCARPVDCRCHAGSALQARLQQALQDAPAVIRAEVARLSALPGEHNSRCVTIMLRLCCTAPSIGAGGLFWSAALVENHTLAAEQLVALDEACTLLDYLVRLDNDLSDATLLCTGDRDGKVNCVTIAMRTLVCAQERNSAIMAAQACRGWLNELFEASLCRLLQEWRGLGACMARGAAIGEAVYTELGHFKDVTDEQMNEVALNLDERWR